MVRHVQALCRGEAIEMSAYDFAADVILPHGANGPAVDIITTKVVSLIRDLDRG